MKNKIIALSVLLSILSGGCVNMQQSKDLLTIDVTKDYPLSNDYISASGFPDSSLLHLPH